MSEIYIVSSCNNELFQFNVEAFSTEENARNFCINNLSKAPFVLKVIENTEHRITDAVTMYIGMGIDNRSLFVDVIYKKQIHNRE